MNTQVWVPVAVVSVSALLGLGTSAASASDAVNRFSAVDSTADCASGVRYDGGNIHEGISTGHGADHGQFVQLLRPGASAARLKRICASIANGMGLQGTTVTADFDLVVYAADGPGGAPGRLLARLPQRGVQVPAAWDAPYPFMGFDVASAGVLLPAEGAYVGVDFLSSPYGVGLGVDSDDSASVQPSYQTNSLHTDWQPVRSISPDTRALSIRAELEADNATHVACAASSSVLCLGNGRFRIEATYDGGPKLRGSAATAAVNANSGYFWFRDPMSVEAFAKIVDGCAINGNYWFFAGGLTNLAVHLKVTDLQTGAVKLYDNKAGKNFAPIFDTKAFATCQ